MDNTEIRGRKGVAIRRGRPPNKNKPGRPEGKNNNVKDEILDAGEILFADLGYAGTTLREVSEAAGVTQALVIYYFGSKYGLFEAVFLRRSRRVSEERMARLQALEQQDTMTVEAIMHAFLKPTLTLRETKQGRAFIRLQARLHTEPPEISYGLRNHAYDNSTKAFVSAFMRQLPHLSESEAYWRMTMVIGAYMYTFSDTHRLEELAPQVCNTQDNNELLENIMRFACAGMKATGQLAP